MANRRRSEISGAADGAPLVLFLAAAGVTAVDVIEVTVLLEDNAASRPGDKRRVDQVKISPEQESCLSHDALDVPRPSSFLVQLGGRLP